MTRGERIALTTILAVLLVLGLFALGAQARDPERTCLPGMMQSDVGGHVICWLPT